MTTPFPTANVRVPSLKDVLLVTGRDVDYVEVRGGGGAWADEKGEVPPVVVNQIELRFSVLLHDAFAVGSWTEGWRIDYGASTVRRVHSGADCPAKTRDIVYTACAEAAGLARDLPGFPARAREAAISMREASLLEKAADLEAQATEVRRRAKLTAALAELPLVHHRELIRRLRGRSLARRSTVEDLGFSAELRAALEAWDIRYGVDAGGLREGGETVLNHALRMLYEMDLGVTKQ